MSTTVTVRMTGKGLLIPRDALDELGTEDLEAVREEGKIVIRPKSTTSDERAQVRQALRDAGMLYTPEWKPPAPVSAEERARLANKLGKSEPLSKVIIADRGDRA